MTSLPLHPPPPSVTPVVVASPPLSYGPRPPPPRTTMANAACRNPPAPVLALHLEPPPPPSLLHPLALSHEPTPPSSLTLKHSVMSPLPLPSHPPSSFGPPSRSCAPAATAANHTPASRPGTHPPPLMFMRTCGHCSLPHPSLPSWYSTLCPACQDSGSTGLPEARPRPGPHTSTTTCCRDSLRLTT